jgi:ABC-type Fe3+-siderophore transport system permease subunit
MLMPETGASNTMYRATSAPAALPLVFAGGGAFLVLSDVVSRTVVRPIELPVGVITALVGVPIFALLLRRSVT